MQNEEWISNGKEVLRIAGGDTKRMQNEEWITNGKEVLRIAGGDTKRMQNEEWITNGKEVLRIAGGDTKRMQNELKTSTTGTVSTVHVQEGATVETGASLITVVAPEA